VIPSEPFCVPRSEVFRGEAKQRNGSRGANSWEAGRLRFGRSTACLVIKVSASAAGPRSLCLLVQQALGPNGSAQSSKQLDAASKLLVGKQPREIRQTRHRPREGADSRQNPRVEIQEFAKRRQVLTKAPEGVVVGASIALAVVVVGGCSANSAPQGEESVSPSDPSGLSLTRDVSVLPTPPSSFVYA